MPGAEHPAISEVPDECIIDLRAKTTKQTMEQLFTLSVERGFKELVGGLFPKELAYAVAMPEWIDFSEKVSHQSRIETEIIKETCNKVVFDLTLDKPDETYYIVDLGCANSDKYEHYAREFLRQGKKCVYVPLDVNMASLQQQVADAKKKFSGLGVVGLCGTFKDGYSYFNMPQNIPGIRLFLNLGSIFFNGPDHIVEERVMEFAKFLRKRDLLVVGQEGPLHGANLNSGAEAYASPQFTKFWMKYLEGINAIAGISGSVQECWKWESNMQNNEHYFTLEAKKNLTCTNFNSLELKKGSVIDHVFSSWKPNTEEVCKKTEKFSSRRLSAKIAEEGNMSIKSMFHCYIRNMAPGDTCAD